MRSLRTHELCKSLLKIVIKLRCVACHARMCAQETQQQQLYLATSSTLSRSPFGERDLLMSAHGILRGVHDLKHLKYPNS